MKLVITLNLNSDAMTDSDTIGEVLQDVSETISGSISWTEEKDGSWTAIAARPKSFADPNGNTVGYWEVTE